jgi:hypothetical protein
MSPTIFWLDMKRWGLFVLISLFCITGKVGAQTSENLFNALPDIAGWKLSPEVEVFNRDNLYERINGAAPLFLENNFQEMTGMEYTQGDQYITIQAYRHATPEDAFGMYASERSTDMTFYPGIGGEAQGDGYGLYFFAGCIYVKMMASDETDAIHHSLLEIAQSMAKNIDPAAGYPPLFATFPKEGLIPHSAAYIAQNYIGHDFLKPVYIADYERDGKKFQVFLLDGKTAEGARKILSDYFRFTRQTDAFSEGNLLIKDRYNGNIPVVWKGNYILGAFDETGEDFPENIYEFLRCNDNL